jgi:methionine-rich copper-binding protein CopC
MVNMKALIVISALCLTSAASAHGQDSSPHSGTNTAVERGVSQIALKERMGQLQLNMLIDSIVQEDEKSVKVAQRSDRAYASNQR